MDPDLLKAIEVVEALQDFINEPYDFTQMSPEQCGDVPQASLCWTTVTLAVLIDEICVWEDQNSGFKLTAFNCMKEYARQQSAPQKLVERHLSSTADGEERPRTRRVKRFTY